MTSFKNRGLLAFCTLLLCACNQVHEMTTVENAEQILKSNLKAPDTYERKEADILWRGQTKSGQVAFIVKIEYSAKNLMGVPLPGCDFVAFYQETDQIHWDQTFGINDCQDRPGLINRMPRDVWIQTIATMNDFQYPGATNASVATSNAAAPPPASPQTNLSHPDPATSASDTQDNQADEQHLSSLPSNAVQTRFGILQAAGAPQGGLVATMHKSSTSIDRPEEPASVFFKKKFQQGDADIVLMESNEGTVCPARYTFFRITASKVVSSTEFGTCAETRDVSPESGKIIVRMTGFKGPFESPESQQAAAAQQFTYIYHNDTVTENGQLLGPGQQIDNTVALPTSKKPEIGQAQDDEAAQRRRARLQQFEGQDAEAPMPASTQNEAGSERTDLGYADKVRRRVRPNIVWVGETADLATVITVRCAPNGTILMASVARSSGNSQWDDAALRAVTRSDPMPLDVNGQAPKSFSIALRAN
jgi:TonB family protein